MSKKWYLKKEVKLLFLGAFISSSVAFFYDSFSALLKGSGELEIVEVQILDNPIKINDYNDLWFPETKTTHDSSDNYYIKYIEDSTSKKGYRVVKVKSNYNDSIVNNFNYSIFNHRKRNDVSEYGYIDLKFRNTTDKPMVIKGVEIKVETLNVEFDSIHYKYFASIGQYSQLKVSTKYQLQLKPDLKKINNLYLNVSEKVEPNGTSRFVFKTESEGVESVYVKYKLTMKILFNNKSTIKIKEPYYITLFSRYTNSNF